MKQLQPPLAWIEASLFPAPEASAEAPAQSDHEPDLLKPSETGDEVDKGWSPEQLATLLQLAKRTVQYADETLPLAPGQIRQLRLSRPPSRPVHLLIQRVGPLFVHGWPVTPDADYASDTDWVLQEDEVLYTPLHLSTSVVQLWNHMVLPVASLGGCVNQLTDDAWQAMQSVSGPLLASQRWQVSMPQAVVSVTELAGYEFVTGAPLILGARYLEERQASRALWARWAEETIRSNVPGFGVMANPLPEPEPEAVPSEPVIAPQGKSSASVWRTLALASVAMLAIVMAVPAWRDRMPETGSEYRSGVSAAGEAVRIDVHLSPGAKISDISAWLNEWGGQIVAGPSETGGFTLSVPRARQAQALSTLTASPLVEKVEVQPKRP